MRSTLQRLWRGGGKTGLIAAAVALLVASGTVVAASPFLKKTSFKKNEGIHHASVDGPVQIPNSAGTLASLELPEGRYAIDAKLYAALNTFDTLSPVVTCRLHSGAAVLDETSSLTNTVTALPLQGVLKLTAPASVELRCEAAGTNDIDASAIKITAVRAKQLTIGSP